MSAIVTTPAPVLAGAGHARPAGCSPAASPRARRARSWPGRAGGPGGPGRRRRRCAGRGRRGGCRGRGRHPGRAGRAAGSPTHDAQVARGAAGLADVGDGRVVGHGDRVGRRELARPPRVSWSAPTQRVGTERASRSPVLGGVAHELHQLVGVLLDRHLVDAARCRCGRTSRLAASLRSSSTGAEDRHEAPHRQREERRRALRVRRSPRTSAPSRPRRGGGRSPRPARSRTPPRGPGSPAPASPRAAGRARARPPAPSPRPAPASPP